MRKSCGWWKLVLGLLLWSAASAVRAEVTPAQQRLVDEVSRRLLAVAEPVPDYAWPPTFEIVDKNVINAYAYGVEKEGDKGKIYPRIAIYTATLDKIIEGDSDRLAFIFGHELSHVLLRHIQVGPPGTTFVKTIFTRQQELDADMKGIELVLKAGYNHRRALGAIERFINLGLEYSSFEGLRVDHPSWKDRIAFLEGKGTGSSADRRQRMKLWRAMSAFDSSTVFLNLEQYSSAERCLEAVTREFPDCTEGWANLGYSRLMQYGDGLETKDLESFGIGQLVVGGFYQRPKTLVPRRALDVKKWTDAVAALTKALDLDKDLVLARANLGVAYLVNPEGTDVKQSTRYLREAAEKAVTDTTLSAQMRATVLVNAGVAEFASGQSAAGARQLDQGERIGRQLTVPGDRNGLSPSLASALTYNRALLLAGSSDKEDLRQAVGQFEKYLRTATTASAWWPVAYQRYLKLCKQTEATPKTRQDLSARQGESKLRLVTSVRLKSKDKEVTLALSEPVSQTEESLGKGVMIPVAGQVRILRYPAYDLELLATDQLLAMRLRGPFAPAVPVRGLGLGTEVKELRVGMTREQLEQLMGEQDYDFRQLEDPTVDYRFYGDMGVGVRFQQGKVAELVIAQVPRSRVLGSGD